MLTDPVNEIVEQQGGKLVMIVSFSVLGLDTWGIEDSSCPGNPEVGLDVLSIRIKSFSPKGKRYAY